jgi:hypothetical protein
MMQFYGVRQKFDVDLIDVMQHLQKKNRVYRQNDCNNTVYIMMITMYLYLRSTFYYYYVNFWTSNDSRNNNNNMYIIYYFGARNGVIITGSSI